MNDEEQKEIEERRYKIEQSKIQIIKDLDRMFHDSKSFAKNSDGRKQLMNTLEVISLKYTGIGYVQGMNFVVAAILYHSSPAIALGIMSYLMEELQLCDIYSENLVGVKQHSDVMKGLVKTHLPNLDSHLK